MKDVWHVVNVKDSKVVIEPPIAIDRVYDDLWLEITGNMLVEQKIEIAQKVADVLNEHLAS